MPSDDEFAPAAGYDPHKTAMLQGAAQKLDEQRRRNENMRVASMLCVTPTGSPPAYVALHDPPEPPDRLSTEEQTVDQAVERITEKGYIFRGMDR